MSSESCCLKGEETIESPLQRICTSCSEIIPIKRIQAVPNATVCVQCLSAAGDVPRIKRYDEYVGEEQVSTYFTQNRGIEKMMSHMSARSDGYGNVGRDERDSGFTRDIHGIVGGYQLPAVFERGDIQDINVALNNTLKSMAIAA